MHSLHIVSVLMLFVGILDQAAVVNLDGDRLRALQQCDQLSNIRSVLRVA